eukprot:scaffold3754_cov99-Isochrysis_galbana.AAC.1
MPPGGWRRTCWPSAVSHSPFPSPHGPSHSRMPQGLRNLSSFTWKGREGGQDAGRGSEVGGETECRGGWEGASQKDP